MTGRSSQHWSDSEAVARIPLSCAVTSDWLAPTVVAAVAITMAVDTRIYVAAIG